MSDEKKIKALREEIDLLDTSITTLLAARAEVAHAIGVEKGGVATYRSEREKEVLDNVVTLSKKLSSRLDEGTLRALYQNIVSACRTLESKVRVAYLGPEGTFTEMAVIKEFGESVEALPAATIDEAVRMAETGEAQFALVPIENSSQGTVTRTLDLLMKTSLSITAEVYVKVSHNLMTRSGKLEGVHSVMAHPQALAQCRQWLVNNVPGLECVSTSSNAKAAMVAKEDSKVAAIASTRAAELYGLKVVASAIQDNPRNQTRFIVLGHETGKRCKTREAKTSLIFSVPNKAGALFNALEPFKRHKVSMAKLESRPANNGAWEYNFYVDVEGFGDDRNVALAFEELRKVASFFKNLGSYPTATFL